jgi:pilus assembly protein Flp/PilA
MTPAVRASKTFRRLTASETLNESGASAAEYVLILAIIGSGIAAGALLLGDAIDGALSDAASYIDDNNISNAG